MHIYILGPVGTFSHVIAQKLFPQSAIRLEDTFEVVVNCVQQEHDSIGILAIENSITSSVHKTVDLLYKHPIHIVGEASMQIHLHLIGKKTTTFDRVRHVFSHPQALAQCSDFVSNYSLQSFETTSTAAALEHLVHDEDAVIGGSDLLKKDETLKILKSDIANDEVNLTRWVCVSQKLNSIIEGPVNKMTYIVQLPHIPGSLASLLSQIAHEGGNLTKIESRPLPGTLWEYAFWIDMEIPLGKEQVFVTLMKKHAHKPRLVGAYHKGPSFII